MWEGASSGWDVERWVASMVSGGLLFAAVRRRSAVGVILGAAAGTLAWWAMSPPERRRYRRGQIRAVLPGPTSRADPVSEASEESFPASDAPPWTPAL